jgi:hypothetical protein
MHYIPTARPGSRAPHVWLEDGRSTLDLFGRGFVLLCLDGDRDGAQHLLAAATDKNVPLDVVALSDPRIAEAYERGLVLVRPDGHVAWRGDRIDIDPSRLIDIVRGCC